MFKKRNLGLPILFDYINVEKINKKKHPRLKFIKMDTKEISVVRPSNKRISKLF